jgi:DNA-binding SARP family transcriptional activator
MASRVSVVRGPSVRAGPRARADRAPTFRLELLGGFELRVDGRSTGLPFGSQRLLAFLALRERPVLRAHVAGTLWPESPEVRAAANLRSALWRLGPAGPWLVLPSAQHLQLAPRVAVDLRLSTALARQLLDPAQPLPEGAAVDDLARDLLPDWFDEWVVVERESFRQLRLHALEALCARLTDLGRCPEAVQAGLAAVAAEPLRESAHRALIRAHLAEGNVVEAMQRYDAFRRLLRDELGLEPSPAMRALVPEVRSVTVG